MEWYYWALIGYVVYIFYNVVLIKDARKNLKEFLRYFAKGFIIIPFYIIFCGFYINDAREMSDEMLLLKLAVKKNENAS